MEASKQERLERLEAEVIASLVEGYLPCPVALGLAARLGVKPREVGEMADSLGIRITACQLGCFMVAKADHRDLVGKTIGREIMERVRASLVNDRLPCAVAHQISRELKTSPKTVGDAATKMKIKISDCQLGCFA